MKKRFIFICTLFVLLGLFVFSSVSVHAEDSKKVSVLDATYETTENVFTKDLGFGITHIKDKALSSAGRLNDYDSCGPKNTLVGQSVNVLSVQSNEAVRIVNWTYILNDGWTKQTVKSLAKNFEMHNPGWKVVAAVNGDFFDINGKQALPYQGNGIHVSNGEVYRPFGNSSNVGFKNDGSSYQLVGGKGCEVGGLMLTIYNKNEEVMKEIAVDKINQKPTDNEISVWYTYNVMEQQTIDGITSTVRNEVPMSISNSNTYIVKAPYRCLPSSNKAIYGKGLVTKNTEDVTLRFGQFAIETANSEIASLLTDGTTIRVQYNLTGKFADCDNVTGAGAQLLKDGEAYEEGGGLDRHPRTCVGIKADGSIVLMTVDGRQFGSDMYGMSYAELSATLLYYGCVEAYNLDGGGSTTIITRNEFDEFDVWNSPSDGDERDDSNALLVVVPAAKFEVSEAGNNSATITYQKSKGTEISNLKIKLNNVEQTFDLDDEILLENLQEETKYNLTYSYDITYKNTTLKNMQGSAQFTTGKTPPQIFGYCYEETEDSYIIHFNISDPKKTITQCYVKYDKKLRAIPDYDMTSVTIKKTDVKDPSTLQIMYKYSIQSIPRKNETVNLPLALAETYNVEYVADGGIHENPISYTTADVPYILKPATKPGFDFVGWFTEDGTKVEKLFGENVTLYARYELATYDITYELDGGINDVLNPTRFKAAELPIRLSPATKYGYTFLGWYIGENLVEEIGTEYASDITLSAKFEKITYTITYILYGGTQNLNNKTTYSIEDVPFYLYDPTMPGYNFLGWYTKETDGTKVLEITDISYGNINLYARYSIRTYDITYNLDGGRNSADNPDHYTIEDLTLTLHNPIREGYKFMGWKLNNEIVTSISAKDLGNVELTAVWEKVEESKKGCGCKKSMEMIITLTSAITLLAFVLRKKH